MNYGICNLSNIPLRAEAGDSSEMVSQVLFGDHFEVIKKSKQWLKVKLAFDNYQGWIDTKQCIGISKEYYDKLNNAPLIMSNSIVDIIEDNDKNLTSIVLGTRLPFYNKKYFDLNGNKYIYEGEVSNSTISKKGIVKTAWPGPIP